MAEVILNCPQCRRSLRVTDDLLGRPVKCPACGKTFTVSSGQHPSEQLAVAADAPVPPRSQQTPNSLESIEDARANARAYTTPAGIFLIIIGVLSFIAGLANVVLWSVNPNKLMDDAGNLPFVGPLPPPEVMQTISIAGGVAASVIGLLLALAGIQMIRLRMYALCIIGSVLAMVNCFSLCCVLGLPLGLWSLIVLLRTDVRAAFH